MTNVNVQANWGEWHLSDTVCDLYLAADVMCSTSSIFHLVAISVDRLYENIFNPNGQAKTASSNST